MRPDPHPQAEHVVHAARLGAGLVRLPRRERRRDGQHLDLVLVLAEAVGAVHHRLLRHRHRVRARLVRPGHRLRRRPRPLLIRSRGRAHPV
ncbi:hypothetical protein SGPA1_21538 [Streptomyces misionensis JCM 4497]